MQHECTFIFWFDYGVAGPGPILILLLYNQFSLRICAYLGQVNSYEFWFEPSCVGRACYYESYHDHCAMSHRRIIASTSCYVSNIPIQISCRDPYKSFSLYCGLLLPAESQTARIIQSKLNVGISIVEG